MDSLRTILVIVDPTVERSPATDKALRIAEAVRARVTLVACLPVPATSRFPALDHERLAGELRDAARRPVERRLDVLARGFRDLGLPVETHVSFGAPPYEAMLTAVVDAKPDLVIKDTHHHAVLRRTLLANTDWHLIRDCPAPLLLVKPRPWSSPPRIAAAVDPGHPQDEPAALDHRLIDSAERLARGFAASPEIVHFWSPVGELAMSAASTTLGGVAMPIPQEIVDAASTLDRDRLEHLARTHDLPASRVRRLEGFASDGLPAFAEQEQIDVLALGAVSRSALGRVFLGSTAERVLEFLPCDALVIKAPPQRAG